MSWQFSLSKRSQLTTVGVCFDTQAGVIQDFLPKTLNAAMLKGIIGTDTGLIFQNIRMVL